MAHVDHSHRAQWLKSIYFISFQRCSTQIDRWNDSNWWFVQMHVFRCFLRTFCARRKIVVEVRRPASGSDDRKRNMLAATAPRSARSARNEHEAVVWPSRHTSLYYLFAECELVNWRAATAVRKQMSLVIPWIKCDFLHVFRSWMILSHVECGCGHTDCGKYVQRALWTRTHFYGQSTIRERAVFTSVGILCRQFMIGFKAVKRWTHRINQLPPFAVSMWYPNIEGEQARNSLCVWK